MAFHRTTATWPNAGTGTFYTQAADAFEAETIVNFILQRDYEPKGVELATKEVEDEHLVGRTYHYLDGARLRAALLGDERRPLEKK